MTCKLLERARRFISDMSTECPWSDECPKAGCFWARFHQLDPETGEPLDKLLEAASQIDLPL